MTESYFPDQGMREKIERSYPGLKDSSWKIKSPGTFDYQCIAWAACDTARRWWPIGDPPITYWPPNVPAEETVEAFVQAFATIGYEPCSSGKFEFGFQKVALYVDDEGIPSHMARQRFVGRGWLSKLGDWEDIVHSDLRNLEGRTQPLPVGYGRVERFLKRTWFDAARFGLFQGWRAAFLFWLYRIEHSPSRLRKLRSRDPRR